MKALVIDGIGGLECLEIRDMPVPTPGDGQVLVRLQAASVDFVDTLIATGGYQMDFPRPFVPGNNLAGVVAAVGPNCHQFAVGDRVHGIAGVGAFAEFVALGEFQLRHTPDDLAPELACIAGVGLRTAYDSLVSTAEVQPGETVAILGASGAVGSAAILIAKLLGARVIACASTEDKLGFCSSLGADEAVRYDQPGFKERLKQVAGGSVDVVLDLVGGDYSEPALRATGYGGRFVVIGFAAGAPAKVPLNLVLLKGSRIMGYEIGDFESKEPEAAASNRDALEALLATGLLVPPITNRFGLDEADDAMRLVAGRQKFGITVLDLARPC